MTDEIQANLINASSLLGLDAEQLFRDPQTGYRAVQKNYNILFHRAGEGGDWKQRLIDAYEKLGGNKSQAKRLFDIERDRLLLEFPAAWKLLREWLDESGGMTEEFVICVDPANESQGELVIKVIVDGMIVPDEDYCLEV